MPGPLSRLVFLSILTLLFIPAPAPAAKGPAIKFERKEVHLENLTEGKTVKTSFIFHNVGKMNLLIDKVTPSCGCTVAEFPKVTTPGSRGEIHIELDTAGITGVFRKTVVVSTNDVRNPYITLTIMGETASRLKVDLGRRITVEGCLGEEISTVATLSDPEGKNILITRLENPMKQYLHASLLPVTGGKEYKLTLRPKVKKAMEFAGPLYFTIPKKGKMSLFVMVKVKSDYSVRPLGVYFGGLVKGAAPVSRNIILSKDCAEKIKVQGLNYKQKWFSIRQATQKMGDELLFEITPKLEVMPKGPFEEKLTIVAGGKVFNVRLKGVVRQ